MAKGSGALLRQSEAGQRRDSRPLLVQEYSRTIRRLVGESDPRIRNGKLSMRVTQGSRDIRLGFLLKKDDIPSESERRLFFEQFGRQHSFMLGSWWGKFTVFSPDSTKKVSFESLPVDYLYASDDWHCRLSDDQLRNALLSLRHWESDFLIVSASLSELPLVAVSSIRNHVIFSKELGLDFPEGQRAKPAKGKLLRLLPYDHRSSEVNVEQVFGEQVHWAAIPCWPPRNALRKANGQPVSTEDPETSFIPKFKKTKPLVFVWPIFMVVGGV